MKILRKQDGIGVIGVTLFLVLIIVILLPGIKIIKLYVDSYKITDDLKLFKSETFMQIKATNPEDIKNALLKSLNTLGIPEITADEITVTQVDKIYKIKIKHQLKEDIMENVYVMRVVDEEIDIIKQF